MSHDMCARVCTRVCMHTHTERERDLKSNMELDRGNDKIKYPVIEGILNIRELSSSAETGFQAKYPKTKTYLRKTMSTAIRLGPWNRIYVYVSGLKPSQACPIQAITRPLKNPIYHWKGPAFRNSFWYAAKNSNNYSDYALIGTLYSTHKKTHHKQRLFFPELCEVKGSGLCVNSIIFMEFSPRVPSAKTHFSSLRPKSEKCFIHYGFEPALEFFSPPQKFLH